MPSTPHSGTGRPPLLGTRRQSHPGRGERRTRPDLSRCVRAGVFLPGLIDWSIGNHARRSGDSARNPASRGPSVAAPDAGGNRVGAGAALSSNLRPVPRDGPRPGSTLLAGDAVPVAIEPSVPAHRDVVEAGAAPEVLHGHAARPVVRVQLEHV